MSHTSRYRDRYCASARRIAGRIAGRLLGGIIGGSGVLTALLLTAMLGGCDYERIDILTGHDMYQGTILTHYSTVKATKTGIVLQPGARFAVKTPWVTNELGQFEVAILSGRGMNVYFRTVAHDFDTAAGICFRYAVDGCGLRMPGEEMKALPYNAETAQEFISINNEASLVRLKVGCTELFEGRTMLPGTEYVIFEALPESTVEIRSVNFFNTDTE